MIGATYIYPNQKRRYKLVRIVGFMYYFECGHAVTDSVFEDLKCVDAQLPILFEETMLTN